MKIIRIPRVYLQLGNQVDGTYPLFYAADGENGHFQRIGTIEPDGYEVACAAAEAYNDLRNRDATDEGEPL